MKRMIPILLMMTLLLTGCAVPRPATEANTYRQITMQEAVEMMEKEENYIILDVRTHEEFAAGHEAYNFAGGFRFYDAVMNDRALIETAYACGMDTSNS